jgi:hypothetical protein
MFVFSDIRLEGVMQILKAEIPTMYCVSFWKTNVHLVPPLTGVS